MRLAAAILAAFVGGPCSEAPAESPVADRQAPGLGSDGGTAAPGAGGAGETVAACVDRWLAAKGLNQYGDAPDTMYAGGSPLFDERTGKAKDRIEYVVSKHPAAREGCGK